MTESSRSAQVRSNLLFSLLATALWMASATLSSCDNEPVAVAGTWRGANADFSDVTLVLRQFRDSVAGTVSLSSPADPNSPVILILTSGHVFGDSLDVSAIYQPTTGYPSINFAGHQIWIAFTMGLSSPAKRMLSGHLLRFNGSEAKPINLFLQ